MSYTTYSFNDIKMVISHPAYPAYTVNGQGIGEVGISWQNDNTAHDVAADGKVMVSKIVANNGSIAITMQQTSQMHQWMKGLFNTLKNAPSQLWAAGRIDISSPDGIGDNIQLTGVSFTKRSDQPFQAQGQMVTWNLMFAKGETNGSVLAAISQTVSAQIINNI